MRTKPLEAGVATLSEHQTEPVEISAGVLWAALLNDTGVAVGVCDLSGRLLFADERALRVLGGDHREVIGRTLAELFSKEFAEERLPLFREVAASGRPLSLLEMVRGVLFRTTYRPSPSESGSVNILVVGEPMGAKLDGRPLDAERRLRRMSVNDMGVLHTLTERELEVLQLIAQGLSTEEVAHALHRSVKTVEWHRAALGNKLGVSNRVELARIAIRAGLPCLGNDDLKHFSRQHERGNHRAPDGAPPA